MGQPFSVQEAYLGFMRDVPRYQLPGGIVWDMLDWIPELDGGARRRFGWQDADFTGGHRQFATIHTGAVNVGRAVGFAPFSLGSEKIVVASDNTLGGASLFSFSAAGGSGTYIGDFSSGSIASGVGAFGRPVFHRGIVVLPVGGSFPSYFDGTSLTFGSGSDPRCDWGTLWGDYTVLAGDEAGAKPQRSYFSAPGNPKSWDTTNSFIDMPGPVTGVQGIRGALLFFTEDQVWRVRGDTPPQVGVIGNLIKDHLYDTGGIDSSIAAYSDQVVFANGEGVWLTDGATVKNITDVGGISTYWRSLWQSFPNATTCAGGIYKGRYIVTLTNAFTNAAVDTLVCDLTSRSYPWYRLSNFTSLMFAHNTTGSEDLYFVSAGNGYVGRLAPIYGEGYSALKASTDQDGAAILPSIETPFYRGWTRFHRRYVPTNTTSVWQRAYVNFESPAGNALKVAYATDPELGAGYTDIETLVSAGAGSQRARFAINPNGGGVASRGIGFKLYQAAGVDPSDIRLNDFELEYYTREGNR